METQSHTSGLLLTKTTPIASTTTTMVQSRKKMQQTASEASTHVKIIPIRSHVVLYSFGYIFGRQRRESIFSFDKGGCEIVHSTNTPPLVICSSDARTCDLFVEKWPKRAHTQKHNTQTLVYPNSNIHYINNAAVI